MANICHSIFCLDVAILFLCIKERFAAKCFTLFCRKEMTNIKVCNTEANYLLQKNWLSATHCVLMIAPQSEDRLEICSLSS